MSVTEDYCSFEVAKLLKEKGFDENIKTCYHNNKFWEYSCNKTYNGDLFKFEENEYSAPTHQMALKWLREVHKININILYDLQRFVKIDGTKENIDVYEVDIITKNGTIYIGNYYHYESACEAAIKYCLTNLI